MAKRVSPTAVGAFMISAIALIVAAVLVLGSGKFFHARHQFVCFFGGSLNGLKVGAPVKFRGVKIGSVTAIRLHVPGQPRVTDVEAHSAALPVFIELDEDQLASLGAVRKFGSTRVLKAFIARGLRAQLVTESLLTGLLYVDLDFHPGMQPKFVLPPGSKYREIPTVPTSFEEIQQKAFQALAKLDKIDFNALVTSLTGAADAARSLVNSRNLQDTIVQLRQTAISMQAAMNGISGSTKRLNANLGPLMASLKKTADQASLTLAQSRATLNAVNGTLDSDSPLGYQMIQTLQKLSQASAAMTDLADYLHRNPSALIRGRVSSGALP
jgi:phospholipid/cholesterol/gamma-HCH transport system substrate-binding protein